MSVPAQLAVARQWAEQIFTDTIRLVRAQPGLTQTDHLGTETPVVGTVYTGRGLVQAVTSLRADVIIVAGEQDADTTSYVVKVPLTVDVQPGDWGTVIASLTPDHVGRWWRVTSVPSQGWELLRRCPADPDAAPETEPAP